MIGSVVSGASCSRTVSQQPVRSAAGKTRTKKLSDRLASITLLGYESHATAKRVRLLSGEYNNALTYVTNTNSRPSS